LGGGGFGGAHLMKKAGSTAYRLPACQLVIPGASP
jgi:hypothetical protein